MASEELGTGQVYSRHTDFEVLDEGTVLWRYMSFAQFVDVIINKRLFFVRADQLEDPWEGVVSEGELRAILKKTVPDNRAYQEMQAAIRDDFRTFVVINCWHANAVESAAMWSIYSRQGIAIRTSFGRLCSAFGPYKDDSVFVGKVHYDDTYQLGGGLLRPFLRKRESFLYENEVRAVIYRYPSSDNPVPFVDGLSVAVDLEQLVESVFVSPLGKDWELVLAQRVVTDNGFSFSVEKSPLYEGPVT